MKKTRSIKVCVADSAWFQLFQYFDIYTQNLIRRFVACCSRCRGIFHVTLKSNIDFMRNILTFFHKILLLMHASNLLFISYTSKALKKRHFFLHFSSVAVEKWLVHYFEASYRYSINSTSKSFRHSKLCLHKRWSVSSDASINFNLF